MESCPNPCAVDILTFDDDGHRAFLPNEKNAVDGKFEPSETAGKWNAGNCRTDSDNAMTDSKASLASIDGAYLFWILTFSSSEILNDAGVVLLQMLETRNGTDIWCCRDVGQSILKTN